MGKIERRLRHERVIKFVTNELLAVSNSKKKNGHSKLKKSARTSILGLHNKTLEETKCDFLADLPDDLPG